MKKCPVCKSEVRGRKDKIYCSESCKSSNQYEKRTENESFFMQVDKPLKTNRIILKRFCPTGYTILRRELLHQEGFNPKYFTHYWKNKEGQVYLFCFDYGFLKIGQGDKKKYLLVQWQPYMGQ